MSLRENEILLGRYRIETLLGEGAMGAVYRALDTLPYPPIPVAIKEFRLSGLPTTEEVQAHPEVEGTRVRTDRRRKSVLTRERAAQQFRMEAQVLYTLRHPNLPGVTEYFEAGDNRYLVMDLIEGEDLDRKLELNNDRPLPLRQCLDWIHRYGVALEYCHELNVTHRDVKPSNIIITREGRAVLVDFGIAKINRADSATVVRGRTAGYSPAEQYSMNNPVDARSDVLCARRHAVCAGNRQTP